MTLDRRARRATRGIEDAVARMRAAQAEQDEAGPGSIGRFHAYRKGRRPGRMVAAGAALLLAGLGIGGGVAVLSGLGQTVPVERPAGRPGEQACIERPLVPEDRLPAEGVQRILPTLSDTPRGMRFARCYRLDGDLGGVARGHHLSLAELGLGERSLAGLRHGFLHPSGYTAGVMETGVLVFRDEAGARRAYRLLLPALLESAEEIEEVVESVREIPAGGLGEGSFGLRGSFRVPGADSVLFAWHRSNLLLWVLGAGDMGRPGTAPIGEMLEVARSMDARAE